ncbi:MAG: hypothetical protein K0Q52_199 [Microbacterium sp.]|jgi:hypothetical protein|nr:hypothetical protein [Microbacterium sp.]
MTTIDTDYEFQVLNSLQVDAIRSLQKLIGAGNAEKGFHNEGREILGLPQFLSGAHPEPGFFHRLIAKIVKLVPALERNYWTARLSLITTEVAEAIEELRNGRGVTETWFSAKTAIGTIAWNAGEEPNLILPEGVIGKPEGVPSEVVDVVVRSFDFAEEAQFDLAEILDRKLAYNASRGKMHGRKF